MTTTTNYEIVVIFPGSLKESLIKKAIETATTEIAKVGKTIDQAIWSARPLAYKIGKEITGTYALFHIAGDSSKIADLERAFRLDTQVIRHLIYKTPKNYVWAEYTADDLEHDYTKLDRDLYNEQEKKAAPAKQAPAKKAAPVKKAEPKIVDKAATSKKLDSVLDELS